VPSNSITFISLIFLADLKIFLKVSLSDTINELFKLFVIKNLLKSLVFLISVFTSEKINKFLLRFFF
tara:strand:- start:606 stop:806 length:201 start_codon:yes stop_codon:yes gene_type:complete